MDNIFTMDLLDSLAKLLDVALHLYLKKPLSSLENISQRLVRAKFHEHVNILLVLKIVLEVANIFVGEKLMDTDLILNLLLLALQIVGV